MDTNWRMASGRCEARVEELRAEFGGILADRIVEAEAVDFLWDARVKERYLGQHFGEDFSDEIGSQELSRIAVLSSLAGRWHVAMCLVDGEGVAVELVWRRRFGIREEAEMAYDRAR